MLEFMQSCTANQEEIKEASPLKHHERDGQEVFDMTEIRPPLSRIFQTCVRKFVPEIWAAGARSFFFHIPWLRFVPRPPLRVVRAPWPTLWVHVKVRNEPCLCEVDGVARSGGVLRLCAIREVPPSADNNGKLSFLTQTHQLVAWAKPQCYPLGDNWWRNWKILKMVSNYFLWIHKYGHKYKQLIQMNWFIHSVLKRTSPQLKNCCDPHRMLQTNSDLVCSPFMTRAIFPPHLHFIFLRDWAGEEESFNPEICAHTRWNKWVVSKYAQTLGKRTEIPQCPVLQEASSSGAINRLFSHTKLGVGLTGTKGDENPEKILPTQKSLSLHPTSVCLSCAQIYLTIFDDWLVSKLKGGK